VRLDSSQVVINKEGIFYFTLRTDVFTKVLNTHGLITIGERGREWVANVAFEIVLETLLEVAPEGLIWRPSVAVEQRRTGFPS
jgi:hypothetical protein